MEVALAADGVELQIGDKVVMVVADDDWPNGKTARHLCEVERVLKTGEYTYVSFFVPSEGVRMRMRFRDGKEEVVGRNGLCLQQSVTAG